MITEERILDLEYEVQELKEYFKQHTELLIKQNQYLEQLIREISGV